MTLSFDDDNFDDLLPADPFASIPAEMKQEPRWLVYRMEPGVDGKKNKIPYDPRTGRRANDPKLGVSFDVAKAALKDFNGLGFYVESPFIVIDIDACVEKNSGAVADYASDIIREVGSFSELSPSGTGVHIWAKGDKPGAACRRGIEIYSTKRFLTVTGVQIPDTPREIKNVDIGPIYQRMLTGEFKNPETKTESSKPIIAPRISSEIQYGGTAVTSKLQLLMTGEVVGDKPFVVEDQYGNYIQYPSHSEADMALANALAMKHEGDAEKIDADFRVSSLMRDKWNRADYRDSTIKTAIRFFQRNNDLQKPVIPAGTPISKIEVSEGDDAPLEEILDVLPDFPEMTGSMRDLSDALSPDIPYAFKMVSAFTHIGLIRSGFDTLAAEPHIQPRFYSALIAGPGRGKTAAMNEVGKVMKAISGKYKTFSSIDSGPALVDAFKEQNDVFVKTIPVGSELRHGDFSKILLTPDELKGVFEKAKITASSRNSMLDELLKLYESNDTGNRVRGMKIKIDLHNAHLGLLGGATESGYAGMWTGTGGASDGLQSRIIPVGIENKKMPSMQRPSDAEKLTLAIQRIITQVTASGEQFSVDEDALKMYDRWWSAKDQTKASEVRVDGIVKRLLVVLARTNDVSVIGPDLVDQAIEFGDFVIQCRDRFNPLDSSTWAQMFEQLIIATFQKHDRLTLNTCRKLIHPERRPGGVGPFLQALKNFQVGGVLVSCGKTQRAEVFRLSL
jgi:putative DNA primase/helicase